MIGETHERRHVGLGALLLFGIRVYAHGSKHGREIARQAPELMESAPV